MKKLSAISFLFFVLLWTMPLTVLSDAATNNNEAWIDDTVDNSVFYVTGTVHLTGSGGTQAGYNTGKEVYSIQQKVTYSTNSPTAPAVQSVIDAAYDQVESLAEKCKNKGKAGEFQIVKDYSIGSPDNGGIWDHRKYETVYAVMINNVVYPLEYVDTVNNVNWYKKEDGSLISDDQYSVMRTHIATGDYGRNSYYWVEANGWVSGYDIKVTNDGNGTAASNLATSLADETVTLNAVPASGFKFKEWQVIAGGAVYHARFRCGDKSCV